MQEKDPASVLPHLSARLNLGPLIGEPAQKSPCLIFTRPREEAVTPEAGKG
jgi:hypothetical protein